MKKQIYLFTFLASLFLSVIFIASTPFINRDGILYLEIATIPTWDLHKLSKYDLWPFYSYFIKILQYFTHLDTSLIAYSLNTFALSATLVLLVKLCKDFTDIEDRKLWIPVAILLAFPLANSPRAEILREPIGLLLLFASLFVLCKHYSSKHVRYFILWILLLGTSCLFRIEYLAFLVLSPFFILVFSFWFSGFKKTLNEHRLLIFLSILIITGCLAGYAAFTILHIPVRAFGRLSELPLALSYLASFWHSNVLSLKIRFLPMQSMGYAHIFLIGGILLTYSYQLFLNLFPPLLLFISYLFFIKKKSIPLKLLVTNNTIPWLAYTASALAITIYIFCKNLFIPNRLFTPFIFLITFPIAKYIAMTFNPSAKSKYMIAIGLLCFVLVDNIKILHSKERIMLEVIHDIKHYKPDCLASNNSQIAYYSGFNTFHKNFIKLVFEKRIQILEEAKDTIYKQMMPKNCPALITAVKVDTEEDIQYLNAFLNATPDKIRLNKKGRGYVIYKKSHIKPKPAPAS